MEQWLICLSVRGNWHRRGYTAISHQDFLHSQSLWSNCMSSAKNPFCVSQHSCDTTSSSYYKGKQSEKAAEKEGQVTYMKTINTTATCAKAVAGEPGAGTDLCYFWLLGFSRYPGTSARVTSASDGIPVFMEDLVYAGLTGLSSSVPTGRYCVRATNSSKVILSEVVLLTAAVSWKPLFFITRSRVEWVLHQRWTLCPKTCL